MTTEDFKRRLTAIFSADVEGYSRLMGEDEDSAIRTLTSYRELCPPFFKNNGAVFWTLPGTIFCMSLGV